MADDDDAVSAAQRRRQRTGQSYFPAADIRSSDARFVGILPPEQNPAYQAAIRRPRQQFTTIQLPSGGTTSVVAPQAERTAGAVSGAYIQPTGPLTQPQYQSEFARGYGGAGPSFNPATQTLSAGGVEAPVESLTSAQRIGFTGASPLQEMFASRYPNLARFGTLAHNAFAGLSGMFGGAPTQYAQSLGAPDQFQTRPDQNYFAYNPSPSLPRRYFDF